MTGKYRSRSEWQEIIQHQKESGLNALTFCRQYELSSKLFYKRRREQNTCSTIEASPSLECGRAMAFPVDAGALIKMFVDAGEIYLCRDPVDFRKAINGLVVLVEQQMALSPFASALFVFCNKKSATN